MMRRKARFASLLITILLLLTRPFPSWAQTLDSYGGTTTVKCPGGAKPHFYTAKIGSRWWLCDPAGNGFFMKGVYNVAYNDSSPDYQGVALSTVISQKYATGATPNWADNWALEQVRRLNAWGFNTLNEYAMTYLFPTNTDPNWAGLTSDNTIPLKLPFIAQIRPSWYAYTNINNWATQPVKELVNGITTAAYNGYRSEIPDIFDPNYTQFLNNELQLDTGVYPAYKSAHNDYLLGFDIDETDNLQGWGAGPDFATADISFTGALSGGHTNPHLAWMILATAPTQTSNSNFGVTYSDKTVYTKQALSNWLSVQYGGNIVALNSAWGSRYTTFGSAGGFGIGTGILDEDGTCPSRGSVACWIGDPVTLAGETLLMQADMSAFLTYYATQYYSTIKKAFNTYAPGFLLLGSSPIGAWGAPPRREILEVASQYLDVFTFGNIPPFICTNCTDVQQRVDFAAQYGGDKPWLNWEGFPAQADSYWPPSVSGKTSYATTQAQRGQLYQQMITGLANTADSGGTHHIVGMEWWDYYDMRSEQTNWGLLTRRDNAYDGVQARIANGTDQWGYPTGGEQANYGDFLTSVQSANSGVYNLLTGAGPTAQATPSSTPSRTPSPRPTSTTTPATPTPTPTATATPKPTTSPTSSPTAPATSTATPSPAPRTVVATPQPTPGTGAIALRGCNSGYSRNWWSAVVSVPGGTVAGDLVVAELYRPDSGDKVGLPTGYAIQYADLGPTDMSLWVITHRYANGDSATPSFSFSIPQTTSWIVCSYANVGGIEGAVGANSGSVSGLSIASATGAGLTTSHANDRLVVAYAAYVANATLAISYPNGLTEEAAENGAPNWSYSWSADLAIPNAGTSTGTLTARLASSAGNAFSGGAQLLLNPSAGPAPTATGPAATSSATPTARPTSTQTPSPTPTPAAAATIALRGCKSGYAQAGWTASVTLPANTTSGDMVVAELYRPANSAAITLPSGYAMQYANIGPIDESLWVVTHRYSGGDTTSPSFSFAIPQSTSWIACSYANVGGIESAAGTNSGTTANLTVASATSPGLVTAHANDRLVVAYAAYVANSSVAIAYPKGLVQQGAEDGSPNWSYSWSADETIATAGTAVGTLAAALTSSGTNSYNAGTQLLLYPLVGAALYAGG